MKDLTNLKTIEKQANVYYDNEEYDLALEYLNILLKSKPDYLDAVSKKATILASMKQYSEAIKMHEQVLLKNPNHINSLGGTGAYFANYKKDYDMAIKWYNKVLKIDPKHEKTNYNMIIAISNTKGPKDAVKFCDDILKRIEFSDKKKAEIITQKADNLYSISKKGLAKKEYEHALKLNPDFSRARINLAICHMAKKKYDQVKLHCKIVLEKEPHKIYALELYVKSLYQERNYPGALNICNKILKIDPTNICGLVNKAKILFNLGVFSEALTFCNQALNEENNNYNILNLKRNVLYKLKRDNEADEISILINALYPDKESKGKRKAINHYTNFNDFFKDIQYLYESAPEYKQKKSLIINKLEITRKKRNSFSNYIKKYNLTNLDIDFIGALCLSNMNQNPEQDLSIHPTGFKYMAEYLDKLENSVLLKENLIWILKGGEYFFPKKTKCEISGIPYTKAMQTSDEYCKANYMLYQNSTDTKISEIKMSDIVLSDELQKQLNYALIQCESKSLLNKKFNLKELLPTQATILHFFGPSGTGKTLTAEAIANKISKKLLIVNYSNLIDKYIGETEKNISAVFKSAKEQDAILLFDEVDAIASTRDNAQNKWEFSQTNVLLKELEKFEGTCILATNHPNILDPSIERRVTMHLNFKMPELNERIKLWELFLAKTKYNPDIDTHNLAKTYEFSGGIIRNVIVNAILVAAQEKKDMIEENHLQQACKMVKKNTICLDKQTYMG